ncbi:hypothetical protein SAMN05660297_03026 [Natronincola peptidivorans]|uniref:DUF5640 domain-containing protein n=1 Tax=Natronincola peptidivorans TaxID=426128 RepID=A0A1I0G3K8_9FIRM|nr:hypothetical protein [Natronincola peptidivorans]SET64457.1 hypothetical protein SAMN05660297_03026 [Natronincola peptidivorans]
MKRTLVSLIMVLVLLFLTSCNTTNDIITLKDGTYILEQTGPEAAMAPISPWITISDVNISFVYDSLSSYLPVGAYTIEENVLTMMTNDGLYKYVFQIDGDKLIFLKEESSEVKLTDDRLGIKITDNAEFKLQEK